MQVEEIDSQNCNSCVEMPAGQTEICIWGGGLSGYTLARAFAGKGRHCCLVDIDPDVVIRINNGQPSFVHRLSCVADPDDQVKTRLRATDDGSIVLTQCHPIHILCIPTERNGTICAEALTQVVDKIAQSAAVARPLYLIIESTIAPVWLDEIVHPTFEYNGWTHGVDYHVGCSPRRDVFGDPSHSLERIAKVFGSDTPECVQLMRELYETICSELYQASDAKHAALTKLIENLFRYNSIILANHLTAALPQYDIAEGLRLASTKWNMDRYHPSLGIGGYCVPLAKDYLQETATKFSWASALVRLNEEEAQLAEKFIEAMMHSSTFERIALLGLSYAPNLKIHAASPSARLIKILQRKGCAVSVHDPYYSGEEIRHLVNAATFDFPSGLRDFDTIIFMTPHREYLNFSDLDIATHLPASACIFDNMGAWRNRTFPRGIRYIEVGGAGYFNGAAKLQRGAR